MFVRENAWFGFEFCARVFVYGLTGCVDWGLLGIKPDMSAVLP